MTVCNRMTRLLCHTRTKNKRQKAWWDIRTSRGCKYFSWSLQSLGKIMGEPSIFSPHDLNSQPYPHLGRPVFFTRAGKKKLQALRQAQDCISLKGLPLSSVYWPFFQEAGNLCGCFFFFPAKKNIAPRIVEALQQGHHCALIAWIDS